MKNKKSTIVSASKAVEASIFDVKKWGRAPRSVEEMVERKKIDLAERAAGWLESKLPESVQQQIKLMNLDEDNDEDEEELNEEDNVDEEDNVEIGDDEDKLEVEEEDYGYEDKEVDPEDIVEEKAVEPKESQAPAKPTPAAQQNPAGKRVISISKEKESVQNSFDDFFENPLDEKMQGKLFTAIESFIHVMTKVKEAKERKEAQEREAARAAEREKRRVKRQTAPLDLNVDLEEEGKTRASVEATFRYFQKHGRLP